jgi:hypothetical protein
VSQRFSEDEEALLVDVLMRTLQKRLTTDELEAERETFPTVRRSGEPGSERVVVDWGSRHIESGFDGSLQGALKSVEEIAQVVAFDVSEDYWLTRKQFGPDIA